MLFALKIRMINLKKMEAEEINQLFSVCDKDSKGFLNRQEFYDLCFDLNLAGNQIEELFNSLDINSDGKIEKQEFLEQFHSISESCLNDSVMRNKSRRESLISTSTPVTDKNFKNRWWEKFLYEFGHVVFGLLRLV